MASVASATAASGEMPALAERGPPSHAGSRNFGLAAWPRLISLDRYAELCQRQSGYAYARSVRRALVASGQGGNMTTHTIPMLAMFGVEVLAQDTRMTSTQRQSRPLPQVQAPLVAYGFGTWSPAQPRGAASGGFGHV